jgi:hypothetical protein
MEALEAKPAGKSQKCEAGHFRQDYGAIFS